MLLWIHSDNLVHLILVVEVCRRPVTAISMSVRGFAKPVFSVFLFTSVPIIECILNFLQESVDVNTVDALEVQ